MSVAGLTRRFFNWNRRIGDRIDRRLSGNTPGFAEQYNRLCAAWIDEHPGLTVLDVGTGKKLSYAHLLGSGRRRLIGCDISAEEMSHNQAIDEALVCDAAQQLTLPDGSVDFLTSHYCIEHLPDVAHFLGESSRVLKSGGRMCVIFAGGYSLHAVLNRILPNALARRILYFFLPGTEVSAGFKAYYDLGTRREFSDALAAQGFRVEEVRHRFGSRGYFKFFLPFYLIVLLLDWITELIGYANWASDFVFIATKERDPRAAR